MKLLPDSQFSSTDIYVYLMPVSHYFYYYSPEISFEIRKFKSSNFILFPTLLSLFWVPMNFRIILSIPAKKGANILIEIVLNL